MDVKTVSTLKFLDFKNCVSDPFLGSKNCVPLHFSELKKMYPVISEKQILRSEKWIGTQVWDTRNGSVHSFEIQELERVDPTITRKYEFLPFFSTFTIINLLSCFIHLWSLSLALPDLVCPSVCLSFRQSVSPISLSLWRLHLY